MHLLVSYLKSFISISWTSILILFNLFLFSLFLESFGKIPSINLFCFVFRCLQLDFFLDLHLVLLVFEKLFLPDKK